MADKNTYRADLWRNRAVAWELAAISFRYPDEELANAVANGEWANAVEELAGALNLELDENWTDGLSCATDPVTLTHELRPEATRLFVVGSNPVASPYEGVWRAEDEGVDVLMFVNPHSMEVERFCKACGLGRPEGTNEPLDHVVTECELMQHLAQRATAGADRDDVGAAPHDVVSSASLPGGSPQAAYEQFATNHIITWLPRFAEKVGANTQIPFYRAASAYLSALLKAEMLEVGK